MSRWVQGGRKVEAGEEETERSGRNRRVQVAVREGWCGAWCCCNVNLCSTAVPTLSMVDERLTIGLEITLSYPRVYCRDAGSYLRAQGSYCRALGSQRLVQGSYRRVQFSFWVNILI